ncbi:MAG: hypothetical protein IJ622_07185 [Bacteroidales bacterium]|nr:hypothetical protein [Bacteroidales bacterium]
MSPKRLFNKMMSFIGLAVIAGTFAACQPKTLVDEIDALEKQVKADAQTLSQLEAKQFMRLEKDFIACDSMLQYLHPEAVEESLQQLQLVGAYIEQFKATRPVMLADIDTTLLQLSRLKADIESRYLNDSLANLYLEEETQHVERLSHQVDYFKDRFENSQKDLDALKKMR